MFGMGIWQAYRRRLNELKNHAVFPINQEQVIYHCPLTDAHRRNLALQEINKRFLRLRDIARPHIVHVGVTTACNLRCPACPTGSSILGRTSKHLNYDIYTNMVDGLRGSLLMMLFWDWGEPFLHPRLADMLAYAHKRGICTVTSTNGNAGCDMENLQRLAEAQPDVIKVCIDGATQDVHEIYRRGSDLSEAIRTIERLVAARQKLGSRYPVIEVRTLALRSNQAQLPRIMEIARSHGADIYSVKSLRPCNYGGQDMDRNVLPTESSLVRYDEYGEWNRKPDTPVELTCRKPLYAPTLNSDGHLAFCCYVTHENEFLGDMNRGSFRQAWNSPKSRRHRLDFLRHHGTQTCVNCFFRGQHKETILHTVQFNDMPDGVSLSNPETPVQFLDWHKSAGLGQPV